MASVATNEARTPASLTGEWSQPRFSRGDKPNTQKIAAPIP